MIRILQAEIIKAFARPRSYIGMGSIIALVALIDVSFYFTGAEYIGLLFQSFDQVFSLEGTIINGNLICFIILQTLIIQLPLLVALVTGDLISGESAMGNPFASIFTGELSCGCKFTREADTINLFNAPCAPSA